jgi:hypothetical protein
MIGFVFSDEMRRVTAQEITNQFIRRPIALNRGKSENYSWDGEQSDPPTIPVLNLGAGLTLAVLGAFLSWVIWKFLGRRTHPV